MSDAMIPDPYDRELDEARLEDWDIAAGMAEHEAMLLEGDDEEMGCSI